MTPADDSAKKKAKLNKIWSETANDRTRLVEYLSFRGLPENVLDDVSGQVLRFHPSLDYWDTDDEGRPVKVGTYPAMVAKVVDVDGKGVTLHRTYLSTDDLDKAPVPSPKKLETPISDGATHGAAIRLSPAGSVLGLTEGIETALAVQVATGQRVWAALSAEGMKTVILPDDVQTVHLWGDNDPTSHAGQKAAAKAAERFFGEGRTVYVHVPPGKKKADWLDVYKKDGAEPLLDELVTCEPWKPGADIEGVVPSADWEPPLPLDSPGCLPTFPAEVLPKVLRDMATEIAESRQVPVDMPAVAILGIVAASAAGRYITHLPTHEEPLNLYLLPAVDPGTRKTQVVHDVSAPLHEIEHDLCEEAKPQIQQAKAQHDLDEERYRQLKSRAGKTDDPTERQALQVEMAALLDHMQESPNPPRLLADDVTPERLAYLLSENSGVMAIVSAEGGIVGMMAGRYQEKGGPNLDIYLKAHSGDPVRIDRASDSGHPRRIDHPALTMLLMVQPEILAQLARVPSARGRGLLGRFLYSLPECGVGTRTYQNRPVSRQVERDYHDCIRRMMQHPIADTPRPLQFSDQALDVWVQFANTVEVRQGTEGDLRPLSDWASKAAGAVARIAGGLHVAIHASDRPEDIPIALETAAAAVDIGWYFVEHAMAAYALMSDSEAMKMARRIASWIDRHSLTEFSLRDCHQDIRTEQPTDLLPGLHVLEGRYIVRRLFDPPKSTAGRTPSPRFAVNPDYRKPFTQFTEFTREGNCVNSVNVSLESEIASDPYEVVV